LFDQLSETCETISYSEQEYSEDLVFCSILY